MDSLEFNKFAAAILVALLVVMGIGKLSDTLYAPQTGEHAREQVAALGGEGAPAGGEEAGPAADVSLAALLARADPAAGESVSRKCASCHTFEKDGADRVGPNLWGVVGAQKAHSPDFAYSDAITGLEGAWTFEDLDAYLASPRAFAPGTKMTFAGLNKPEDRANLLAWLNEQSDSPLPLPEPAPEEAAAGEEGAAAEGAAAVTGEQQQATAEETQTGEAVETQQPEGEAAEGEAAEGGATAGGGALAMIAAAAPEEGESAMRKCKSCHTFEKDGANRVGPNLWGVVGRDVAGVEDYSYSSAMDEVEGSWTYQKLFTYLQDPRGDVPGTKMSFAGIKDEDELAALIAWLRLQADQPEPLEGAQ